jgi:hypothetical protein
MSNKCDKFTVITIRMSEAEKEPLETYCKDNLINQSAFVRKAIEEKLQSLNVIPTKSNAYDLKIEK